MANTLYVKARERILQGQVNFVTDTIKAVLLKNSYAPMLATDEFLAGIAVHRLGTDQTLAGKSVAGGAFAADDIIFPSVAAGDTTLGVALYKDTGNAATSPLLAIIDQITGFPLATNGGNIGVNWDNGVYKIFSL